MKNKSILITAPSGAGKTTLVKMLLDEFPNFKFSVSATTRSPRISEEDGKDYFFIDNAAFEDKIKKEDFLEWEEVYNGTKYGTLKSEVEKIWKKNQVAVFDIDIMGALKIKKLLCQDILSIFIAPPNFETLEKRLRGRKTETEDKLQTRVNKAKDEMKFENFFDHKIINDDIEVAYFQLKEKVMNFLEK
jgi:guanylate kinase